MNLPHEVLTPIKGNEAPYDPRTETTPNFMNGKFSELLENDQALNQQINVLAYEETSDLSTLFLNGVTKISGCVAVKKGNSCTLSITVNLNGFNFYGSWSNVILYLPVGFRPKANLTNMIITSNVGIGTVNVNANTGAITRGDLAPSGTITWISLQIPCYVC